MSDFAALLDKAYEHPETVPWENHEPPQELVQFVETRRVRPCTALDIGCGTGHYSVYLTQRGFAVAGIDVAPNAIARARENAVAAQVDVRFETLDARNIATLGGLYGFVFEWGMLHFMMPEFRKQYVRDVAGLMEEGAVYLVLTFNDQSPEWGGPGVKYRTGITGTRLYYSSMEELVTLYAPYFAVEEARIRPTFFRNSGNEHLENYLLLRRRS